MHFSSVLLLGTVSVLALPNAILNDRASASANVISLTIPSTAPNSAPTLARSLFSISIEGDRWPEWAGTTSSPNSFFYNALNNLGQITGRMPDVRIGANSEDHTSLDESVNVISTNFPDWTATVPYPEAKTVAVSSAYYQLSQVLPPGTHVTWGVNLGSNSQSNVVAQTNSIVKAFNSAAVKNAGITLDFIEIGNEADLYGNNGLRASGWSVSQYYTQWLSLATSVASAAGMTAGGKPGLLLASFANSDFGNGGWSPQTLYDRGVLSSAVGKYITTVSQHHYSGTFCQGSGGLLADLMNKYGIQGNISQFDEDINAATDRGLTYIFGETNSYSCHGAPGVSNTAGAAIWTLNYALMAAAHNIRRVHFHDGIGFKYNLIQPVTLTRSTLDGHTLNPPLTPHVQPQYYAAILAAHFIGRNTDSTTGTAITTSILELDIADGRVSGYAAYDNGALKRAVFINNRLYVSSQSGARGTAQISLAVSGKTKMRIRRLAISSADLGKGLKYAGQSYEDREDGLVSGTEVWEDVSVSAGVGVSDTEAVLVEFS